ncbi:MAG: hypothetical protein LBR36_08940 [Bacteroidales bacterium]|jgi:hypothetical protein|nr:hypothetical protein [Bacteroidales bacterium]
MKKQAIVTAVVSVIVLFSVTSCKKDGVYNPDKRISKVYESTIDSNGALTPKTLQQTWIWGDKTLEKIIYANGGIMNFTYNSKNQLIKGETDSLSMEITYKNNKYDQMTLYVSGETLVIFTFSHKNGKISQVEVDMDLGLIFGESFFASPSLKSAMNLVLPEPVTQSVLEISKAEKRRKANTVTLTIKYKWEKDNIVEANATFSIFGSSKTTMEYDNHINPFKNLVIGTAVGTLDLSNTGGDGFSKNNVVKVTATSTGTPEVANISYKYDGDYPIEKITESGVIYYEYM